MCLNDCHLASQSCVRVFQYLLINNLNDGSLAGTNFLSASIVSAIIYDLTLQHQFCCRKTQFCLTARR